MEILGGSRILLSPHAYSLRAVDFLTAAKALRSLKQEQFTVVAFLYCRASELALKAFLLARGNSTKQVRSFVHDLQLLLIEAYARGFDQFISLSIDGRSCLLRVNEAYTEHKLAYFEVRNLWDDPIPESELQLLADTATQLTNAVATIAQRTLEGDGTPLSLDPPS